MRMVLVDYAILADAISFYRDRDYTYIEVQWTAPEKAMTVTTPGNALLFPFRNDFLVASGEQSFIHMMQIKALRNGKYMCVTPCFRDEEQYNKYTKPYFMKVELIVVGEENDDYIEDVLQDAEAFFNRYLPKPVTRLKTEIGIDLMCDDIELGSYGSRNHKTTKPWVYGTGVAEPRFSQVLQDIPGGYSVRRIPKGEFGELSKIREEVEELDDAMRQEARIMALVELADLYGAMEGFLERHMPGATMKDVQTMSAITRRVFENGYRT